MRLPSCAHTGAKRVRRAIAAEGNVRLANTVTVHIVPAGNTKKRAENITTNQTYSICHNPRYEGADSDVRAFVRLENLPFRARYDTRYLPFRARYDTRYLPFRAKIDTRYLPFRAKFGSKKLPFRACGAIIDSDKEVKYAPET